MLVVDVDVDVDVGGLLLPSFFCPFCPCDVTVGVRSPAWLLEWSPVSFSLSLSLSLSLFEVMLSWLQLG